MPCSRNLDLKRTMTAALSRVPKIALCITEDWFALSHFKPLIRALQGVADTVVVITNVTGRADELTALGVRVLPFDYERKSTHPLAVANTTRRLMRVLATEQPDAIHLVALKPIVLGALAAQAQTDMPIALHLTGLGLLAVAPSRRAQVIRRVALWIIGRALRRPRSHLFIENPDDLALVRGLPLLAT
jgi:Glycosyl transferase 4-like